MNGTPLAVGVMGDDDNVQVGGALEPQLRFTGLLYPLNAVSVPLNVADVPAFADKEGLLIASP